MITHLLFFILVLLLAGLAPAEPLVFPLYVYLSVLVLSFLSLVACIYLQNRFFLFQKKNMYLIAQVEILFFLFIFYYFFNGGGLFPSHFLSVLLAVTLYLGATGFYYFSSYWRFPIETARQYALKQIKTLIPFALPMLIFTLLVDIATFLGFSPYENFLLSICLLVLSALFLAVVFPPAICKLWDCKPLENGILKERLEAVCKQANFSHAGLKNWNLYEFFPTAAIIGILSQYRYILFTPSLLKNLSPEAIEAVLAHEIGHSKYKHLLFFPFLLIGMVFFLTFALQAAVSLFPSADQPATLFVLTALMIAIYFRFVLGFFSRLFERQADLYGMKVGVPLHAMIEALDTIGKLTGNSHKIPNWHHFSIHQRIEFLKKVEAQPELAEHYHKYVSGVRWLFLVLLGIFAGFFFSF